MQFAKSCEKDQTPLTSATILARLVGAGELHRLCIANEKRAFVRLLERALPKGAVAIGAMEVTLKGALWLLHVHVLLSELQKPDIDRLRVAIVRRGFDRRGVRIDPLHDLPKQCTYLAKFVTGHRPGDRTGQLRQRMYPLPSDRYVEIMHLYDRSRFDDFLVHVGVRRRRDLMFSKILKRE